MPLAGGRELPYTPGMPETRGPYSTDHHADAIDLVTQHVQPPTPLEAALRPGCLLSLIITLLLIVVIRRFAALPLPAYVVLFALVYLVVIGILVRLRPSSSVFDDH
ncbi:MAG: hypothetical protein KatS3mg059_0856 [Thermomicrobiales bacterium]|nr:MAG: hypothetical protein KatS3mg059_0856 [Thermomicrobiales bacterium]